MKIGIVIKQLRQSKGLTQADFAKECDLSQTALSQIETGATTPHQSTLDIIASKLQIPLPVLYLMCLEEKDVPKNKRNSYRMLFPMIQGLINQLFLPE